VRVNRTSTQPDGSESDRTLLALCRAIAARDSLQIEQALDAERDLASRAMRVGASREDPQTYFLAEIRHYVYAGDTALHVAAASHQAASAELLVERGADVCGRNRRGAEPLHYAADRNQGDPMAQRDVIAYLIEEGANPNALDKSGVAPLHRAVRTRSSEGVAALIENGADPLMRNKRGSTPLHLAVQTTGASHSGSDKAREEQGRIVAYLLEHGASPTDRDAKGKTVADSASSDWIRNLLGVQ
jgi:ankyrin repeat protein